MYTHSKQQETHSITQRLHKRAQNWANTFNPCLRCRCHHTAVSTAEKHYNNKEYPHNYRTGIYIYIVYLIYLIFNSTYGGSICVSSFSVFCFSISSSSVLSLISSSRLDEYCSSILSMESMMLVFFPLFMFLNWRTGKITVRLTQKRTAF